MLDEEFRRERATLVRDLAEKSNDPFTKQRLLRLAERYDADERHHPLKFVDLQFASRGNGPER